MTKQDIISHLSNKHGLSNAAAKRIIEDIAGVVRANLVAAGSFTFPGVGKFRKVKHNARIGRNPKTGEPIEVQAVNAVRFRAAAGLKRLVNGDK